MTWMHATAQRNSEAIGGRANYAAEEEKGGEIAAENTLRCGRYQVENESLKNYVDSFTV